MAFKELGNVAIDSGTLIVGDPCYVNKTEQLCITVDNFGGDGFYPVFADIDRKTGLVSRIVVEFTGGLGYQMAQHLAAKGKDKGKTKAEQDGGAGQ